MFASGDSLDCAFTSLVWTGAEPAPSVVPAGARPSVPPWSFVVGMGRLPFSSVFGMSGSLELCLGVAGLLVGTDRCPEGKVGNGSTFLASLAFGVRRLPVVFFGWAVGLAGKEM
ncbi:hypothetical protein SAMN05421869_12756 [Nonomuraea jiangxiensis]|uniref:Uncharacterized protein n=1 Tax=Nonomuraea jiangxiensis TaxID=633440 RepID=A0A1G9L1Z1_9ACTN|nr:hypothetical protein SAMN05421869_12756 [Nonomuraea jiangxiensis]